MQTILSPVDFSELSANALRYAAALAHCGPSKIVAVHASAFEPPPHADHSIANLCAWIPAAERSRCEIRDLLRQGDAAEEIVALAAETSADLLVVGARHRPFADSSVLGNTTVRTVRHAPCPVLTVIAHTA